MSGQETIKAYSFKQTYLHHINNFDIGVIHVPTHPTFTQNHPILVRPFTPKPPFVDFLNWPDTVPYGT